MGKKLLILFASLLVLQASNAGADDFQSIQTQDLEVFFAASLKPAATDVVNLYPEIMENLEIIFRWSLHGKPSILLIKTRNNFLKMIGNPLVVAYAVPDKNRVVLDCSRVIKTPFSLETTLKHELTHLLLHQHITGKNLPRWLDEGLCQWASGGVGEIIMDPKQSLLNRASLSGKFIPLIRLERSFPIDRESQILAYEESQGFVTYLIDQFGKEGIRNVLNQMKNGVMTEVAIQKAFSTPFDILEKKWHRSLRRKMNWFAFLSYYLYEILFTLMALITVLAFIRLYFKKKCYGDEEENGNASDLLVK